MDKFFRLFSFLECWQNGTLLTQEYVGLLGVLPLRYHVYEEQQKALHHTVKSQDMCSPEVKKNHDVCEADQKADEEGENLGQEVSNNTNNNSMEVLEQAIENTNEKQSSLDYSCLITKSLTYCKSKVTNTQQRATLLELANNFRENDPKAWKAMQSERELRNKGSSLRSEKMDTFLQEYYERQQEIEKQKHEKEIDRKSQVIL